MKFTIKENDLKVQPDKRGMACDVPLHHHKKDPGDVTRSFIFDVYLGPARFWKNDIVRVAVDASVSQKF